MQSFRNSRMSSQYMVPGDISDLTSAVYTTLSGDVYSSLSGLDKKLQRSDFQNLSNSIQLSDKINTLDGTIRELDIVKITPDEYTEHTASYQLSNQIVLIQEDQLDAYDQRVVNVADPIYDTDAMTLGKFKSMLSTQIRDLSESSTPAQIVEALKKIYTL